MKLRRTLGVVLSLAIAAWAGARALAVRSESSLLVEMEHNFNRALQQRDARFLDALLTSDYLMITPSHAVVNKQEFLAQTSHAEPVFDLHEAGDIVVQVHGDTAVTTGLVRQRYWKHNRTREDRLRFSHTWVRSGHDWRLLTAHWGPFNGTPDCD
jgi:ketosteroid isomerase-like protein